VSQQVDKSVMTTSVTLISGLVLLAVVLFMVAALIGVIGKVAPDDNSRKQAAVLERIKPVARVSSVSSRSLEFPSSSPSLPSR